MTKAFLFPGHRHEIIVAISHGSNTPASDIHVQALRPFAAIYNSRIAFAGANSMIIASTGTWGYAVCSPTMSLKASIFFVVDQNRREVGQNTREVTF